MQSPAESFISKRKRSRHSLPTLTIVTRSSSSSLSKFKQCDKHELSHPSRALHPKQSLKPQPQDQDQDHFETQDESYQALKRVKFNNPLFYTEDASLAAISPSVYNVNHEDEDFEDLEDEEMPKFQYESKYRNSSNKSIYNIQPTTTTLSYTPEERQMFNDMLFNRFIDLDGSDSFDPCDSFDNSDSFILENYLGPEPALNFAASESWETDSIPLVTLPELDLVTQRQDQSPTQKESQVESLSENHNSSLETRWPIGMQDDSTSFSTLGQASEVVSNKRGRRESLIKNYYRYEQQLLKSSNSRHLISDADDLFEHGLQTESQLDSESLNDFFMYDTVASMSEDESDGKSSISSFSSVEPSSPTGTVTGTATVTSPSLTKFAVAPFPKNIPICGYRDRNLRNLIQVPVMTTASGRPLNPKRIMAALASLSPRNVRAASCSRPSFSTLRKEPLSMSTASARTEVDDAKAQKALVSSQTTSQLQFQNSLNSARSTPAHYNQQLALVLAEGLNCRSLFSGRAGREMIALGGKVSKDFWA